MAELNNDKNLFSATAWFILEQKSSSIKKQRKSYESLIRKLLKLKRITESEGEILEILLDIVY